MRLERTRWGVPRIVACTPGKHAGEGLVEIEECPCDDDVVVDAADSRDHYHAYAKTCSQHRIRTILNFHIDHYIFVYNTNQISVACPVAFFMVHETT